MGLIDFIKGAGAKIFGSDSPAAEQAKKKAAADTIAPEANPT